MAQVTPIEFNAKNFAVHARVRSMHADASDLGLRPGALPYSKLYDDACDAGLQLVNHETGITTRWYLADSVELDADGDIVRWEFKPTSETLRKCPGLEDWMVTVYND